LLSTGKYVLLVFEMSKESKKFKVPDQLANLYDFANSLDARHFTHHGAQHVPGDELKGRRELGAWSRRCGSEATFAAICNALRWSVAQITTRFDR
jgi:hypothetical protein